MFGEYSLELRVVWNPAEGFYVQSYVVSGVDGPFDSGEVLRMATVRPERDTTLLRVLSAAAPALGDVFDEVVGQHGVQPRLL